MRGEKAFGALTSALFQGGAGRWAQGASGLAEQAQQGFLLVFILILVLIFIF